MNHYILPAFRFSFSLALSTLWLLGVLGVCDNGRLSDLQLLLNSYRY